MLSNKAYNDLLHDLKRLARIIEILKETLKEEKQISLVSLIVDELDRMWQDIEREKHEDN